VYFQIAGTAEGATVVRPAPKRTCRVRRESTERRTTGPTSVAKKSRTRDENHVRRLFRFRHSASKNSAVGTLRITERDVSTLGGEAPCRKIHE
jgi:hypothetical protein